MINIIEEYNNKNYYFIIEEYNNKNIILTNIDEIYSSRKSYFHIHLYDLAEKSLRKCVESSLYNNARFNIALAETLFFNNKILDSLSFALRSYKIKPDPMKAILLGNIYRKLNDFEEAIFYYKIATSYKEKYLHRAKNEIFFLYLNQKKYHVSNDILKKIIPLNTKTGLIQYKRMEALLDQKLIKESDKIWNQFKEKNNINNSTWCFFNIFQLGDVVLVASLINRFSAFNKETEIKVFFKKKHFCIAKLFLNESQICLMDEEVDPLLLYMKFTSFSVNAPIVCHPMYLKQYNNGMIHKSFNAPNNNYPMNHFVTMLNIPYNTKPLQHKDIWLDSSNDIIARYKINKKKSIIVCPHANSIDPKLISISFWNLLVKKLISNGYTVYLNYGNDDPLYKIKGIIPIEIPLKNILNIFEYISRVITIRSGIADLLLNSEAKTTILYPQINNKFITSNLSQISTKRNLIDIHIDNKIQVSALENIVNTYHYYDTIFELMSNRQNSWYFILPHGALGDIFIILLHLITFTKDIQANQGVDKVKILYANNRKNIISYFYDYFDFYESPYVIDDNFCNTIHNSYQDFVPNKLLICHPRWLMNFNNGEERKLTYQNGYYMQKFATALNLKADSQYSKINIKKDIKEDYNYNFKNTIVLANHSNSINKELLPLADFWFILYKALENLGYDVFFNVGPEDISGLDGYKTICTDIKYVIPLYTEFLYIISIRSGLCDMLASHANLISIIPNNSSKKHLSCTLNSLVEKDVIDIVSDEDLNITIEKILKIIKGENK